MGSVSAMNSIDRVLEKHGDDILADLRLSNPSALIESFALSNNVHSVSVTAKLTDGAELSLEPLGIDQLTEDYPDCEVGY